MKILFDEHDGCFVVDLTAENLEEAALLTRFGMNRTDKLNHCSAYVARNGEFSASIVFAKNKRANNDVHRRK